MAKKMSLGEAFHEVYADEPSSVKKSGKKGAEKRKMLVAIAMSKAQKERKSIKMGKHDEECLRRGYTKC